MSDVDPEVERLVRVAYVALEGPIVDPDKAMTADEREAYTEEVTAVLADLRERYVLVPREEAEVRQEWTNSRRDYPNDDAQAWTDEEHADSLRSQWNYLGDRVDAKKGNPPRRPLRKFTRTTIIHHTPWELTE